MVPSKTNNTKSIFILEHSQGTGNSIKQQLAQLDPDTEIYCYSITKDTLKLVAEKKPHFILVDLQIAINSKNLQIELLRESNDSKIVGFINAKPNEKNRENSNIKFDGFLTLPISTEHLNTFLKSFQIRELEDDETKFLDLTYLNQLADNDLTFKLRVIEKLISQTSDILKNLEGAYTKKEWVIVGKLLHKLAGSMGNVTTPQIKSKILDAEKLVNEGEVGDEFKTTLEGVYKLCDKIIINLTEEENITKQKL